jgi:diguanylate cyclase (GGDEF)-like protein
MHRRGVEGRESDRGQEPAAAESVDELAVARFTWHRGVWIALAAVLVLGGSIASVLGARAQSHKHADRTRQEFRIASSEVAASLVVAIEHEQDLVVSTGAFMASEPRMANSGFVAWARRQLDSGRYPEVLELGEAVVVPFSRMSGFAASARREQAGSRKAKEAFIMSTPGSQPLYCLARSYVAGSPPSGYPVGLDWCNGPTRSDLLAARDTASSAYRPIRIGAARGLTVFTPVYRDALPPASVAARRSAFIGWVNLTVVPTSLLARALAGHPAIAVTFSYRASGIQFAFHQGSVPPHAESLAINLDNGWTVRTFTVAVPGGLLVDPPSVGILVGGIAFSLVLGGLLYVLGTGRTRAWRLVSTRTAQLRHQALHDSLTGLPNRSLIADRVERLLARSRRTGHPGAMLFIDIDDFKDINDTLGHEAGDQLLTAVSARLTTNLREVDTVGRLGGDEFLLLIDGESEASPEYLAQRVVSILRDPFLLDASDAPITISASVGVAVPGLDTSGELMRHADVALYQAKAAGKNRFAVFDSDRPSAAEQRRTTSLADA